MPNNTTLVIIIHNHHKLAAIFIHHAENFIASCSFIGYAAMQYSIIVYNAYWKVLLCVPGQ